MKSSCLFVAGTVQTNDVEGAIEELRDALAALGAS